MPLTSTTLETSTSLLTEAGESTPALAVSPLGIRGIQVVIGGRDLTSRCDNIVFSATDQGGFEIATLGLPAVDRPKKGEAVTIRIGLVVAWMGRVVELSDHSSHAHATKTVGCEGWQALLKDNPMQMVYVDRDLSHWGPPSAGGQKQLLEENYTTNSPTVAVDTSSEPALPALLATINDSWVAPFKPNSAALYDAGPGNIASSLYYDVLFSANGGGNPLEPFSFHFVFAATDALGSKLASAQLATAEHVTGVFTGGGGRYAYLTYSFPNTPAGSAGATWQAAVRNLAVYGNHGLTPRGPDPGGFYPSDIVRHVLSQLGGIQAGVIDDSTSYIAPHVVYRAPTDKLQIINDMAKLMGWTWGVWQPPTMLDSTPRLDFRSPPTDATVAVTKAECDELDITSRLGDLYDTAIVSYSDPAGTSGEVTVKVPNPQLYEAGISERTLQLEGGLTGEAEARALGTFALALSQIAARAAGQATLPASVKLPGGGSKPSALLRPGLDRLRITDLIDGGPLLEQGTGRRDVFRISRVETTIGADGAASTRVELDNGTNLLEALQARLALAAGVVGSGAGG